MTSALLACALLVMSNRTACDATYQDDKAVCQCQASAAASGTDPDLAYFTLSTCIDAAQQARRECKARATKEQLCN